MSYDVKAEVLLRINEGDHPNLLWTEEFTAEGEMEVVDSVKTHMISGADIVHSLFCAIQEALDKDMPGIEVDRAYAVSCAKHLIKHYDESDKP